MEEILNNKMVNNSEVARKLGISPPALRAKITKYKYAKLTKPQQKKLYEILVVFRTEIDIAIRSFNEKM